MDISLPCQDGDSLLLFLDGNISLPCLDGDILLPCLDGDISLPCLDEDILLQCQDGDIALPAWMTIFYCHFTEHLQYQKLTIKDVSNARTQNMSKCPTSVGGESLRLTE